MRPIWLRMTSGALRVVLPLFVILASFTALGQAAAQENGATTEGLRLPLYGQIEGKNGEQGTFEGSITDLTFSNDGEELILDGLLNGLVVFEDRTVRIENQEFSRPVEPSVAGSVPAEEYEGSAGGPANIGKSASVSSTGGSLFLQQDQTQPEPDPDKCDVLYLDIQPIELNLLGLEVLTSRITVDVNAIAGEGNLAGNLLCSLGGLLDGLPDTLDDVTDQLNQIVEDAGSALETAGETALDSLPVFLTFEDQNGEPGTFQGTISELVFSEENGVLLDGVLNGIANIGGDTVRVVNQELSSLVTPSVVGSIPADQILDTVGSGGQNAETPTPADQNAETPTPADQNTDNPTLPEPDPDKCDVLFLDIQPITLNLLGLEVLTSRITVDVNAIPGEGNLAGNLVCALAGLLDGTPDAIGEITDQLNQIVDEIGVASSEVESTTVEGTPPADEAAAEPTAEATEAAAEPTEAVTEPTEAAAEPTTVVESTLPAEPTEAVVEPTEVVAEPTVAAPEPTAPPA